MTDTYIGEIKAFATPFVPEGWIECDGQLLSAMSYPVLYDVIGNQFGGDEGHFFRVPDLRGRVVVGVGWSIYGNHTLGGLAGTESVTLTEEEIPGHTHPLYTDFGSYKTYKSCFDNAPTAGTSYPSRFLGQTGATTSTYAAYAAPADSQMSPVALSSFPGAGGAHENRQPILVLRYGINATIGQYPFK